MTSANHLTTGGTDTDGTVATTASISPGVNRPVFVAVFVSASSAVAPGVTVSGCGITWDQIELTPDLTTAARYLYIFRGMSAAPTAGALTISSTATQNGFTWSVVEVIGADTSGTNGSGSVVQVVADRVTGGAETSVNLPFVNPVDSDNLVIGFVGLQSSTIATPGAGYTPQGSGHANTVPAQSLRAMSDEDPQQNITAGWIGGTSTWSAGIEVKAASVIPVKGDLCTELKLQVRLPAGAFVLDHPEYGILDQSLLGGDQEDATPFVLDQSRLDADFISLPSESPDAEWVDLIQFVQSIEIDRGAKATAVGHETEVGLSTFVFIGPELDPNQNKLVVPGAPMRLMTANDTIIFTGTIRSVRSVEDRRGIIRVTITAHDRIGKLAQIKRYGADEMSFIERVNDLLDKHGIPHNRLGGAIDLAKTDYESNLVNHLQLAVNSELGQWWVDRDNIVQVRGMGAVETAYEDVTFRDNLIRNPGFRTGAYGWNIQSALSSAWEATWVPGAGREGRPAFRQSWVSNTTTGSGGFGTGLLDGQAIPVVDGQTYTISAYMKHNRVMPLKVTLVWDGPSFFSVDSSPTINTVAGQWVRVTYQVAAPTGATSVGVDFVIAGSGTVVNQAGDVLEISDAMFETGSTLGDWFDGDTPDSLDGDTHIVYGWYGRQGDSGSYRAEGLLKTGLIRFSNNHSDDPNHACYTDIVKSYDSSVIVNELQVNNLQWDLIEDKSVTVSTVYTDETSRVTWGPASASIDMNISQEWPDVAENNAAQIIDENAEPRNQITALTWNATVDMERAAAVEPFDHVFVEFENDYYVESSLYRVLGVRHDISGDLWLTTLTLDQVKVG